MRGTSLEEKVKILGEPIGKTESLWRHIRLSTLLLLLSGKAFIPSLELLRKDDPLESYFVSKQTVRRFRNLTGDEERQLSELAEVGERSALIEEGEKAKTNYLIWTRILAQKRAAWCWYGSDVESMAQWDVFARDGVAIRTDISKLVECLNESADVSEALIGRIKYCDRGEDQPEEDYLSLRPYFLKQKCYAHEKEVRVILPIAWRDSRTLGLTVDIDWRKLVAEVQISPRMEASEADAVKMVLRTLLPSAKVGISSLRTIPDGFKLRCDPLFVPPPPPPTRLDERPIYSEDFSSAGFPINPFGSSTGAAIANNNNPMLETFGVTTAVDSPRV